MNFSQWIEVDGQTICNQIDISEEREDWQRNFSRCHPGCNVHGNVDHWEATIATQ